MNLEWLLTPVTQHILVGVGLLGSLALWISFVRELHSVRNANAESTRRVGLTVKSLSEAVEQMQGSMSTRGNPDFTTGSAQGTGSKRAQALLLHLGGEPASNISAALGTPQNEIELMLKLSRLLQSSSF